MNYVTAFLAFLFFASVGATVFAATTSTVNVTNNVNTSSSTSSKCSSHVENHITVEVNGEKKVIDDVKDGCSVNSNIKVEAKSENGKTTINVSGDPQSVKSATVSGSEVKEATISANSPVDKDPKIKKENFFAKIVSFFTHLFSSLKFWK